MRGREYNTPKDIVQSVSMSIELCTMLLLRARVAVQMSATNCLVSSAGSLVG